MNDTTMNEPDPAVSELARHADPSVPSVAERERKLSEGRGVQWVRPTDLIAVHSARVSGRGIDFQAELARRARAVPARTTRAGIRAASARVRRLPPVSAFGRGGASGAPVSRSGIGLG